MIYIEINKNNLIKLTSIILNNLDNEKLKENEKIALYYLKINEKDYYYSYNLLKDAAREVSDSYYLVNASKAKLLLKKQMS